MDNKEINKSIESMSNKVDNIEKKLTEVPQDRKIPVMET